MLVEWIFQHVQTEIEKKKKKKKRPANPKFWSVLCQYEFFQALNVVLESGYSGHSLHIDIQHCFALRQFLLKKKKKKKKKVVTQPTNRYAIWKLIHV